MNFPTNKPPVYLPAPFVGRMWFVPEHFNVSENSEYKFNPKVDLVENLGNEKIVYIKMDQYEISAKIPSHHTIKNIIGFNSKNIFVFDGNGKRIKS